MEGRASVGRLNVDEKHNQVRHLGDSHFSFLMAGNESGRYWQSSRASHQMVVDKEEY